MTRKALAIMSAAALLWSGGIGAQGTQTQETQAQETQQESQAQERQELLQAAPTQESSSASTEQEPVAPRATEGSEARTGTEAGSEASAERPQPSAAQPFLTEQADQQIRSDDVVGQAVIGHDEQSIGKIEYLVLDPDGKVEGVVVAVGGFLGIGAKSVGLPWESLALVADERGRNVILAPVTREELDEAPEFMTQAQIQAQMEAERRLAEQQQQQRTPPLQ